MSSHRQKWFFSCSNEDAKIIAIYEYFQQNIKQKLIQLRQNDGWNNCCHLKIEKNLIWCIS